MSAVAEKVLLTGGSGFIASHVLDQLLDQDFQVVTTVRSEEKGRRILESLNPDFKARVSYVVVPDVAGDGAFDAAVQSDPPFDYVVHTASPYYLNATDPKEFLEPAMKGTMNIVTAVDKFAPTVKRIVLTSSSAAILNPKSHAKVYDESVWSPITFEEAMDPKNAYRGSKTFSEKLAWEYIEQKKPKFDLATINNTYTFGPIPRHLSRLDSMNTSNHRIRDMIQGRMKDALAPTAPVFTFVDVRDVALAHVRAMTVPEAGGNRFYLVAEHFSNKRIADVIRSTFPELAAVLPPEDSVDDLPDDVYRFNNQKSRTVLGLEYTGLEKSVQDTVRSILDVEDVKEADGLKN